MEHIGDILKQTRINTSKANTGTWSSAEEETESSPDCPVCKGAGFVHPLLPNGKPDYGQVVACRCTQQEIGKERQSRLQRYSNLGLLTRFTFDQLTPQGRSGSPSNQEQFQHAYAAAKTFAAEPKGWLILGGPSGSGKTHLAAAIVNERLDQGQPAFYITTPDLLDHLRSAYNPGDEMPYDEFFSQVRNAPLLVLDDLGVQSSTPWAREKLDQLLTYRFNRELPTVVVTIIPVEDLDDRLRTRLTDSRLCQLYEVETKQTSAVDHTGGLGLELLKKMTFEKFDYKRVNLPPEQRENLEQVFRIALSFAQSPEGWLVLQGANGCGKTHLAAAIANYQLQAGKPALFIVVPEFLDHLRSTFSPDSRVSYDQLFESAKNAPLLVLDDFGEQSATPWAQEKLYQVINYRYNAQLPTVITTIYALEEIENRISSRLMDPRLSLVFNITAPDYRGDKRAGQRRTAHGERKSRWG
jgi:DNA replication protein DnaC